MAVTNEASIRVTANTASFQADMRKLGQLVKKEGDRMGSTLKSSLKDGFEAGANAAKDLGSSMKGLVVQAATLGGAFSTGAMVLNAVQGQKANIALANSLSNIQGRFVEVAEVQDLVERSALGVSASFEETRENLALMAAVSDRIDIEDALKRATLQSRRLGVEGRTIATIYSRLAATGIGKTAEEVENVTEQIGRTAQKVLGISLEEAFDPNDILEFVTFMQRGNIELDAALNLFSLMEGVTKDFGKGIEVVEELGDALNDVKELEAIREAAGLTRKELNANNSVAKNFNVILGKGPKAIKALTDALGFQARQGLENLLGTEFLDKAVSGKGKIAKGEIEEAQRKVQAIFETEAANKANRVEIERRNVEVANTSAAKFQDAMNNLEKAFQSDEVAAAIQSVAEALPTLVKPIADFVQFAGENPGTALAAAIAGKVGLTFAGATVQAAASAGIAGMFARLAAVQTASAAAAVATQGATTLGVSGAVGAVGAGAGAAGAGVLATGAAVAGGALAAGAVGFGVGSLLVDAIGEENINAVGAALAKGAERRTTRGFGASDQQVRAAAGKGESPFIPGTPAESLAVRNQKVEETERKLISALSRIADKADGAAAGLDKVGKASEGKGPGGGPRGTPKVRQKDGAFVDEGI